MPVCYVGGYEVEAMAHQRIIYCLWGWRTYWSPFLPNASTRSLATFSLISAMVTLALHVVGLWHTKSLNGLRPYPFSAKLVAIKAPKPDAPPVTRTHLSLNMERCKVFDRSAMGVMIALTHRG